ncbi:MAG: acyl-CoA dehydrogenase family protein [Deltaproteobacteria bacterium]|jgi:alkylation response protein AidB-like acyl-CoA dehydrogenase|nr:acyl-CoA dehydrogenase family protein [Deltaproteobacteria bacterium]MBW2499130.1 acyl-CoA dehydrogenase family protein [Deltaproteobacteria bacterium]
MSDLEAFRRETRTWLEEHAPRSLVGTAAGELEGVWGGRKWKFEHPDQKVWLERMAEQGWTAPTWPREYGGGGLEKEEAKVLAQEMRRLKIPPPLVGFGLTMIGPTLLRFGNEEQKLEHLTKICRGEIRWCQGYSEPGSGSDLASLQTRAVREGDEFVINGTKVWTSYADQADWIFALVRSDPDAPKKQEGISFILIDMETPGVSVSPIALISGKSPFCETHFQDVRVPVANVVHEIGAGWTVAKALLGHERSMIADTFGSSGARPRREGGRSALAELAVTHLGEREGHLDDAIVRDRVAAVEMDTRAFGLTVQRSKDAARAGQQPGAESSMFKIYGTELNQRRNELMVQILGPQALGWEGPGFEDSELETTRAWLRSRGNTIEGGTSEIQLNIIAKRVLGLPV